ncbi:MAG: CoA transferase, partial [Acidimicrobiales bacterium]|nr:CoA transferase [Acidimicrobiales bacterium]
GVVCALWLAERTGQGQVVDAGMVDGVMSLAGVFYGMSASGMHSETMGGNLFDGGAPFYSVYETSDGKYVSVAPIEPHFYALLLDKIGLDPADLPGQWDQAQWPVTKARFAEVFRTKTRDEWCKLLENTDACFAPILTFTEATQHGQTARAFVDPDAASPEVKPMPRLSATPGTTRPSPRYVGADTDEVLTEAGFSGDDVRELRASGAIA